MANPISFNPLFIGVDAGRVLGTRIPSFPADALLEIRQPEPAGASLLEKRVRSVAGLAVWQQNKAMRYIDDHIEDCIRVEDIASMVRLSASRFSKAFKVSFGRSPYDYVLARRVEAAKYLITHTSEPLSQVAQACGLSDQAHLSKVFKRLVGVTPLKYRRATTRTRNAPSAPAGWTRLAPGLELPSSVM